MKKVIITTGGTGGHIYPALAVANELKENDVDVIFVGSNFKMEKNLVPNTNIKFIGLDILPPRNIKTTIKYLKAIKEAVQIVKNEKPDAIIGFGNYISVPILTAGFLKKIPIYLQEQNVNLGFANKLFYRTAKKTFLAFENTYDDIPLKNQKKFRVTGNPLRKEIYEIRKSEQRELLNIDKDEKVILITGGSLGAQEINNEVIRQWDKFYNNEKVRIFWATGKDNYDGVIKRIKYKKEKDVIESYFDNMINIMGAADLVICRAGALTISEIIELEKPSILIPYNSVKVGQFENAKILFENGSSITFYNNQVKEAIDKALELVENEEELKKMRIKIRSLKKSNATKTIVKSLDIWRD